MSRYGSWLILRFSFKSIKTACKACLGGCHYANKHKLKHHKRERERERDSCKACFLLLGTPLSPREHIFNYRRDKEDMREFKCNKSIIPPPPSTTNTTATTPSAPSRNRNLTTQHAVQISSGLEITEHLLASVELSAGACQCSGPAS